MKDIKPLFLLYVLIAVLLIGLTAQAQQRRKPQRQPQPRFDQRPFDIAVDNLPPNYLGHSLAAIYAAAQVRGLVAKKGEYESTTDYRSRLAQLERLPLSGSLNSESVLAFEIQPVTQKYNADLTTLDLSLEFEYHFDGTLRVSWLHSTKSIGSYIARNAFNRAVQVKAYRTDDYLLAIKTDQLPNIPSFDKTQGSFNSSIEATPIEAQRLRPRVRALVICQLSPDLISSSTRRHEPKIDEPEDETTFTYNVHVIPRAIWFYDFPSGRVLAKVEIPRPVSAAISVEPSCTRRPSITLKPTPNYPAEAKSKWVEGTVRLSALFKETGEVADIVVIKGLPNGLTESAIEAARGIEFVPGENNGKKASCRIVLEYSFSLY